MHHPRNTTTWGRLLDEQGTLAEAEGLFILSRGCVFPGQCWTGDRGSGTRLHTLVEDPIELESRPTG